jgi:hypothetical protein
MYLCVMLDLYSRRVVGGSMGPGAGGGVGGAGVAGGRSSPPTASGGLPCLLSVSIDPPADQLGS